MKNQAWSSFKRSKEVTGQSKQNQETDTAIQQRTERFMEEQRWTALKRKREHVSWVFA
jgi:hypothetical protein